LDVFGWLFSQLLCFESRGVLRRHAAEDGPVELGGFVGCVLHEECERLAVCFNLNGELISFNQSGDTLIRVWLRVRIPHLLYITQIYTDSL